MNNCISKKKNPLEELKNNFKKLGIFMGLLSGLSYGFYSTFIVMAQNKDFFKNINSLIFLAFFCAGFNDFFAGIFLFIYNLKNGKLKEFKRSINTFPGKMIILGAIIGGPIANATFLLAISLAGASAIPISATYVFFGVLLAFIFLKQKPSKRVILGMFICILGAIIINISKETNYTHFFIGISLAFISAISWGIEGVISSFGGSLLDSDIAVNIREFISSFTIFIFIIPFFKSQNINLLNYNFLSPLLFILLSGLCSAISFLAWYKSNAMVGCAVGMSLNVSYAFFGVILSYLFLKTSLSLNMILGSLIIILGIVLISLNPLEFLKGAKNEFTS